MAMGKTQRTEILIETHEVCVIRFTKRYQAVTCEICSEEVYAFTAEEAGQILNVPSLAFGGEGVHSVAERTPHLLCGASLGATSNAIEKQNLQQEIRK